MTDPYFGFSQSFVATVDPCKFVWKRFSWKSSSSSWSPFIFNNGNTIKNTLYLKQKLNHHDQGAVILKIVWRAPIESHPATQVRQKLTGRRSWSTPNDHLGDNDQMMLVSGIWVRMVQLGIILLELTNYNCRRKISGISLFPCKISLLFHLILKNVDPPCSPQGREASLSLPFVTEREQWITKNSFVSFGKRQSGLFPVSNITTNNFRILLPGVRKL